MNEPAPAQGRFFKQVIEQAEDLAEVLRARWVASATSLPGHCTDCFDIEVAGDVPAILPGFGRPIGFGAESGTPEDPALVFLWHQAGRLTGVEVTGLGDRHPTLDELKIGGLIRRHSAG